MVNQGKSSNAMADFPMENLLRTMSFLQVVRREVAPLGTLGTSAVRWLGRVGKSPWQSYSYYNLYNSVYIYIYT